MYDLQTYFPIQQVVVLFLKMSFDAHSFQLQWSLVCWFSHTFPLQWSLVCWLFSFVALALVSYLRIHCQTSGHEDYYLYFPIRILWFLFYFFRNCLDFAHMFSLLTHFELIFVYGVGGAPTSSFYMWEFSFPGSIVLEAILFHWLNLVPLSTVH